MIRVLHRWPGLLALALVTVLALSGGALSVFPAAERLSAPQAATSQNVADLAERIQRVYPGVEQIRRAPSGRITAFWFDGGTPGAAVIDPASGRGVTSADPNQTKRWLTNLHRSLFLGDGGRIAMASAAAAMLLLSFSGVALVARRVGGWRHWFTKLRGPLAGRLHVEIARFAVLGLALSSVTALWMTASTFDLLPDGEATPAFTAGVSGETGARLSDMALLAATPVSELRDLSFPYAGDASDVFRLSTEAGTGYLDQGTGMVLGWADRGTWEQVSETIYMLHTGEGAALLGLVLGVMALGIPAMGVTGVLVWLAGRRGRPRLRSNRPANRADTILLVGSEGGSTWGFAATLHAALTKAGFSVHTAPMSAFAPQRYSNAARILVLAATYGDGDAPASAKGFLDRLEAHGRNGIAPIAILGFGDRSFPAYCAFAKHVEATARAKGWGELLEFDTVDRQSPQDFARWGQSLGKALGIDLCLEHQPISPKTDALTLISRRDYGADVQAPTAILRFALPRATFWQQMVGAGFSRFNAGDLIGILPESSPVPRLYSLASAHKDGFVEFVVRKHPGGLCSGQLCALEPGDTVTGFLQRNSRFQPGKGRAPLILIGAGTGIGPLAGFVRGNTRQRPIHLFFGMRHPSSDYLFDQEIQTWSERGHLSRLVTANSRDKQPHYVQDALRNDAAEIDRMIRNGARIMVCGGRDMAAGVADALADILAPVGLSPAELKEKGRYVEDVY